jgi:hypothetical protein
LLRRPVDVRAGNYLTADLDLTSIQALKAGDQA